MEPFTSYFNASDARLSVIVAALWFFQLVTFLSIFLVDRKGRRLAQKINFIQQGIDSLRALEQTRLFEEFERTRLFKEFAALHSRVSEEASQGSPGYPS
jgi:hypothetical protein